LETKQTSGMLYNRQSPYGDPNARRDRESEQREAPCGFMTWVNTDGDLHAGADPRRARGSGAGGTIMLWNHTNGIVLVGAGIRPDSERMNTPLILEQAVARPNPLAASRALPKLGQWYLSQRQVVHPSDSPADTLRLRVHLTRPDGSRAALLGTHKRGDVWVFQLTPDQQGLWRHEAEFSDGAPGHEGRFLCVESDRSSGGQSN
jgi:hypothetical protein